MYHFDHSLFANLKEDFVEIRVTTKSTMKDKYLFICIAYKNNCLVLSRVDNKIIYEYWEGNWKRGEKSLY